MILGTYGKGKKTVSLEEIEAKNQKYNEMILSGKGLPPIKDVKPSSEREKRIQQMILNGEGLPPLRNDGMNFIRRK